MASSKRRYYHDGFYHTPTVEDGRIGILLSCAGHYVSLTHKVIRRTMDEWQIVYLNSGSGWVECGGQRVDVAKGDLFFVFPHMPHSYGCHADKGWDITWAHFKGDYAARLMDYAGFSLTHFVESVGTAAPVKTSLARILKLYQSKPFHYHIDGAMELAGLLTRLKTTRSHGQMRHPAILDAVDYRAGDINTLAKRAGYSKYHFIRLFKQATGISPWNYLLLKRIDKAKELLAGGPMSVREVAYAVGFTDPDYFSKIFHRRSGVTPLQFRKKIL